MIASGRACWVVYSFAAGLVGASAADNSRFSVFEKQTDIGRVSRAGSATVESSTQSLIVTGGGENMWFTNDAFHFFSCPLSGDFDLQAAIAWVNSGGNAHRKACLMARQTLDADSAYVDVAVHGDGLISLQFREISGGPTHEIQAPIKAFVSSPQAQVALRRQGDTFFLSLADENAPGSNQLQPCGAFTRLSFSGPVFVGLAVCAHDDSRLETARFSTITLSTNIHQANAAPLLHSSIETISLSSKDRRVLFHTTNRVEAPNWSRDGKSILFNGSGRIYRLPLAGGAPEIVETGFAIKCNNDHGFSPDGTRLAISDQSRSNSSLIYLLPASGGAPRLVTSIGPSYWHGWSPDGLTLAYCAERHGEFDIYTIPAQGGEEKRLTSAHGLDDGPDYSPDGKYIYFNSERTGTMQIWRMASDGSRPEQVTSDDFNNWFPHPSPDGKWLVFLSYEPGVTGHPANQPVRLRFMPLKGGPIQELAKLFGGQGTINVPSWSPDSRQLAFVSYELLRHP